MGYMESIFPELALCGSKNVCARTDTVFFPISEVSEGTVSLKTLMIYGNIFIALSIPNNKS